MKEFLNIYFKGLGENLLSTLKKPDAYLNKIALTTATIILGVFIHILLKKFINKNVKSFKGKIKYNKIAKNTMLVLTIILVLFIWIQAINAFILIGLLFIAFIIVMLRGLVHNIIGYFVIKYKKYFEIGNRIEFSEVIGDVIDINPISFKLLEVRNWLSSDSNTGRIIQVPNSIIFEESIEIIGLKNIFVLHEIKYTLSFDSNWRQAESIMREVGDVYFKESVLTSINQNDEYLESREEELRPIFSLDTDSHGIIVNLQYLVDYRYGTSTKTYLQRKILNKFEDSEQIKFAVSDIRILSK